MPCLSKLLSLCIDGRTTWVLPYMQQLAHTVHVHLHAHCAEAWQTKCLSAASFCGFGSHRGSKLLEVCGIVATCKSLMTHLALIPALTRPFAGCVAEHQWK